MEKHNNQFRDPTKKVRMIDANELAKEYQFTEDYTSPLTPWTITDILNILDEAPTVDAIPMDDIKLHHILIDNEGVPEVKIQIGDRYFIIRTDPVDVREVKHGRWEKAEYHGFLRCSECKDVYIDDTWVADGKWNYCPNCGAKMDGDGNG